MADLTTIIQENVTVNGQARGGMTTQTITGVNNVLEQTITLPANATTAVLNFDTAVSGTTYITLDKDLFKYARLTNSGTTNVQVLATAGVGNPSSATEVVSTNRTLVPAGGTVTLTSLSMKGSADSGNVAQADMQLTQLKVFNTHESTTGILEVFVATA